MIIDMLTRWLNFEFGVLSHLKTVSLQPIAMQTMLCRIILKFVWFSPMVAPSSDQRQKA